MKKSSNALVIIFSFVFLFAGCVKDVLNKSPQLAFTKEKVFATFDNTQNYALGLYTIFPGYSLSTIENEFNGDLMSRNRTPEGSSNWIWNRVTVPSTSGNWDFSFIRKVNLMLEGVEKSKMTREQIDHWKSVGYFFRAYQYFDLLKKYGDVPWIDKVVTDADKGVLYAPRTPRDTVADNMLKDLLFAEEHIWEPGTHNIVKNSVSADVVRALISRFGLFEGTWRKYHNLNGADKYLQASAKASAELIERHPDIAPNFGKLFTSESLEGVPGVLLYKQYELGVLVHLVSTFTLRSSESYYDITKKGADKFLLSDGKTRWSSPLFKGDKDPHDEFRDRDLRMLYTIVPPYKVVVGAGNKVFEYTQDPKDREYIDLMDSLIGPEKPLPVIAHNGNVNTSSPSYADYREGYSYDFSYTGYLLFKFYCRHHDISKQDINDYPIFRMGEVLVNYAEAEWELGKFTQQVADMTINKLRERAGVAPMIISDITPDFDPTRDPEVSPVLWEIRRERAVELMGEGFRFDDLRRWKKMDYTNKPKLGRWIKSEDVDGKIPIQNGADEGYIQYWGTPPDFPDYYYLYPIPSEQIELNSNIKQNPGWKS